MYRNAKPVDWCQCCQQRVSFTDPECAADFLGDDDSAEVIDPSYNACCFHISSLLVNSRITMLLFVKQGDLYATIPCFYHSPKSRFRREAREYIDLYLVVEYNTV